MENQERIVELLLGLIFVSLLLISVIFVLVYDEHEKKTIISTSYNTNNYNNYLVEKETVKPIYVQREYLEKKDFLDYSSYGKHFKKKDFVGSYVDEFRIYVTNEDFQNGYFKVIFYFEDYYGEEDSESVTHYIKAGEESEFRFKDIQFERYKYSDWRYEVIPEFRNSEINSKGTIFYDFPNNKCH